MVQKTYYNAYHICDDAHIAGMSYNSIWFSYDELVFLTYAQFQGEEPTKDMVAMGMNETTW